MLPHDEDRISLKAACREPLLAKDGRPLSLASAYRYVLNGVRLAPSNKRVRLEHERGPRGTVTSREAVKRFIAALNGADQSAPKRDIALTHRRAAAELDALGV